MIESFLFIIIFLPAQKFLLQNCQNEQKVSENLYTSLKNRHRNSLFQINEHRFQERTLVKRKAYNKNHCKKPALGENP